jgi:hypothetical protein
LFRAIFKLIFPAKDVGVSTGNRASINDVGCDFFDQVFGHGECR